MVARPRRRCGRLAREHWPIPVLHASRKVGRVGPDPRVAPTARRRARAGRGVRSRRNAPHGGQAPAARARRRARSLEDLRPVGQRSRRDARERPGRGRSRSRGAGHRRHASDGPPRPRLRPRHEQPGDPQHPRGRWTPNRARRDDPRAPPRRTDRDRGHPCHDRVRRAAERARSSGRRRAIGGMAGWFGGPCVPCRVVMARAAG